MPTTAEVDHGVSYIVFIVIFLTFILITLYLYQRYKAANEKAKTCYEIVDKIRDCSIAV